MLSTADEVARRRRGVNQTAFGRALPRREHFGNRALSGFSDRTQRLFYNVGQTAFFIARGWVGAAVGFTHIKIVIVPGHLLQQASADFFVDGARRQQMNRIAYFGDFGKHDGRPAAHQQIGGIAHRRVGGHARKRIAAAALHTDHQFGGRAGFALALVQLLQMALGDLQNVIHH